MNQDYSKAVLYRINKLEWEASPAPGVWRKKLDRENAESGRATSLVRYDPGSSFKTHVHDNGEEILVLDGVFSDESGNYPTGWYFRNPPGSSHAPSSKEGCLLFVKLCHFKAGDNQHVATHIDEGDWQQSDAMTWRLLHQYQDEQTLVCKLKQNRALELASPVCREIVVLEGNVSYAQQTYPAPSWLRIPTHDLSIVQAGENGAVLLVKTGHFTQLENKA